MSGVAIVTSKLINNANLTAVVPSARIQAGIIPINSLIPAISIMQISATPRLTVNPDADSSFITERVQVTLQSIDYPQQKQIMQLIRESLTLSRGTVNGYDADSILHDDEGADFFDPDLNLYIQTQDFIVKFTR